MFLVCHTEKNNSLVIPSKKESSTSLSPYYYEYNLLSKTINITFSSLLLLFSAQISNPLNLDLTLLFTIKKYSKSYNCEDIGSTYIFSSKNSAAKTFSFQFLDKDLSPGKYTYLITVSSNCFTNISPGLIIPSYTLNFINGN